MGRLMFVCVQFVVGMVAALPTGTEPGTDLPVLIPDTSSLDSDALHGVGADKFLTLWHINVLSGSVVVSDEPWTVLAPLNSGLPKDPSFIIDKEYSREILLNHVILGDIVDPELALTDVNTPFYSLADTELSFSKQGDTLFVNGIRLTGDKFDYANGVVYIIEKTIPVSVPDYLKYVPAGDIFDSFNFLSNPNQPKQLSPTVPSTIPAETVTTPKSAPKATRFDRFRNRDIKESVVETAAATDPATLPPPPSTTDSTTEASAGFLEDFFTDVGDSSLGEFTVAVVQRQNETFLESLKAEAEITDSLSHEFLHHFLDIQLDRLLQNDNSYTAIIPTDDAFYDYYPIDWGFNPFLVKNFTKQVLINHVIPANVNLHALANGTQITTLGGTQLLLTKKEGNRLEINGHLIPPEFDLEVPKGRIYYVDTLFFVDYDRVNELRESYPHLETGPLISFPWPTSPFLSHLVKRLQEQPQSSLFEKLLSKSSIAPFVSSSDKNLQRVSYTVFIPNEEAIRSVFNPAQIDFLDQKSVVYSDIRTSMIDEKKIDNFLLDHIFSDYLFKDNLTNGLVITSLSESKAIIARTNDQISINGVRIIGEQQYIYNLGAIFMIDGSLSPLSEPATIEKPLVAEKSASESMSVPFPSELIAGLKFPPISDPNYRFETRTEVSFSKQINNGEIIPVHRSEVDKITRNLL